MIFQAIIVAQDVRVEMSGQSTVVGFMGLSPGVTVGVPHPDMPVPQVSFLCLSVDPVEIGKYAVTLTITDPAGRTIGSPANQVVTAKRPAQLGIIFQFVMFPLAGVGKYGLDLVVNGNPDLKGSFTIRGGPVSAIR